MLRGYRIALCAAFGWLILAANQPKAAQPNPQPDRRVGDALSNISATLERQEKDAAASPEKQPCQGVPQDHASDLCAQWTAAEAAAKAGDWAEYATYVAGGSLLLSMFGLWALLRSLNQTDKSLIIAQRERASTSRRAIASAEETATALREAGRSASAMENVAKSMAINAEQIVHSVAISRDIAEQQQVFAKAQMRAYLSVLIGGARYQDGGLRFEASPIIVNNGNTPARNIRFRVAADILPVPLPDDFKYPLPAVSQGSNLLGPGQDGTMMAVVTDRIPDAEIEIVKAGVGKALHVWGVVRYDDIFGKTHRCTFSQQLFWRQSGPMSENGEIPYAIRGWYLGKHNRTN